MNQEIAIETLFRNMELNNRRNSEKWPGGLSREQEEHERMAYGTGGERTA